MQGVELIFHPLGLTWFLFFPRLTPWAAFLRRFAAGESYGPRDGKILFFCPSQAASAEGAVVEAVQALGHAGAEQRVMADGEEIFGDEP